MASRAVGHARLARRMGREGLTLPMAVGGSSRWVGRLSLARRHRSADRPRAPARRQHSDGDEVELGSASPRIYSDLRAAALLGGYYFNYTSLAPHLDFNDALPGDNYTCSAVGVPQHEQRRRLQTAGGGTGAQQQHNVLQRIAAAGFRERGWQGY